MTDEEYKMYAVNFIIDKMKKFKMSVDSSFASDRRYLYDYRSGQILVSDEYIENMFPVRIDIKEYIDISYFPQGDSSFELGEVTYDRPEFIENILEKVRIV